DGPRHGHVGRSADAGCEPRGISEKNGGGAGSDPDRYAGRRGRRRHRDSTTTRARRGARGARQNDGQEAAMWESSESSVGTELENSGALVPISEPKRFTAAQCI